jgi:hypothetical protein
MVVFFTVAKTMSTTMISLTVGFVGQRASIMWMSIAA